MSRNLKKDYLKKMVETEAPNGYKFDLANYVYNPSYDYDYPSFTKVISEDDEAETVRRIKYFKHYDGSGEYIEEIYRLPKDSDSSWVIIRDSKETILEKANRFNLKKLLSFC